MSELGDKIRSVFGNTSVYKDPNNKSLFSGRNLPSFVKDYLISSYTDKDGNLQKEDLLKFLDLHIPANNNAVKSRLMQGEILNLLTRFIVTTNIRKDIVQFKIPDMGIKENDTKISRHLIEKYPDELIEGEHWGILQLVYRSPMDERSNDGYIEMSGFKPFNPWGERIDLSVYKEYRGKFTIDEWIDVLLSAMEYTPEAFKSKNQKLEFLTRLLPFIEPRLNMIELAPKGTGKSYVFSNLSKYAWLVSGGQVTRAQLFYNRSRGLTGYMAFYDLVSFDEISTISFSNDTEMQAILKSYLEDGKTTVDNYEFISECGLMLLGNIQISEDGYPLGDNYFEYLPNVFKESALLDRFHGFIEGWLLPRVNTGMALHDWTINVEFFSEIMHQLRTDGTYVNIVNQLLDYPTDSDMRHIKAVKRMTTAYLKLLFPNVQQKEDIDIDDFNLYCLQPAIRRRDIIRQQCSNIDRERTFAKPLPEIKVRRY